MAIEIRELVIRTVVGPESPDATDTAVITRSVPDSEQDAMLAACVEACVKEVWRKLQKSRER